MLTFETAQRELVSFECRCGEPKKMGDAFCLECWRRLPAEYRAVLVHFCRRTRAGERMGRGRKALIYWRCLVKLGLAVKRADPAQFRPGQEEAECSDPA
jgi:hypothetical protein